MAGVINTGSFPRALLEGVNAWFGRAYDQNPEEWRELVDVFNSSKNYEEDVQEVGLGLAQVKPQGASIAYDSMQQGYIYRYSMVTWALGFQVTREEMMDNLYAQVGAKRAGALARAMKEAKEINVANLYNRAFDPAYTFGDGKELIATDHPLASGGTLSNELATPADLSETSLEDLIVQMHSAVDDRGIKIKLRPTKLVIAPANVFNADRILKSTLQNDTGNNAVNALRSLGAVPQGYTLNHYLTDADAWFLRTDVPDGLKLFQREAVRFGQDNDFDTENAKFKAVERYQVGATDSARAIYGSAGA